MSSEPAKATGVTPEAWSDEQDVKSESGSRHRASFGLARGLSARDMAHVLGEKEKEVFDWMKTLKKPPTVKMLGTEREETYLELFYDLIIVVVFIRLGTLLKYEPTYHGFFIVVTLFLNFWSAWSMFNFYITSLDEDDIIHRGLYIGHILTVFITAIYLTNVETEDFSMAESAHGMSLASMSIRLWLGILWLSNLWHLRGDKDGFKLVTKHSAIMFVSAMLFGLGAAVRDGDSDAPGWMWLAAIAFEQIMSIWSLVWHAPDFDAAYAGERMQAWIMLCLGESVISLLSGSIKYEADIVLTTVACFGLVTLLCIHYFDVVDADQYLKHFVHEGRKVLASAFLLMHGPWSFCTLLVGIGMKGVIYVAENASSAIQAAYMAKLAGGRRLGGWDLWDYEENLNRYMYMIAAGSVLQYFFGNAFDAIRCRDDVPAWRQWGGRLGATAISLVMLALPNQIRCMTCPFDDWEDEGSGYGADDYYYSNSTNSTNSSSHRALGGTSYGSSYGYGSSSPPSGIDELYDDYNGIKVHEALTLMFVILVCAYAVNSMVLSWMPMNEEQLHRYHGHHFKGKQEAHGHGHGADKAMGHSPAAVHPE